MTTESPTHRAAQRAARDSYGRLLGWLAWQWGDLAAAEDALSEAFAQALQAWPATGIPAAPESWLLTVAKRNLLQVARHAKVVADPAVVALLNDDGRVEDAVAVPDTRLRLMFVCAHPAIDVSIRTPLMLQTVLGMTAQHIAAAMLLPPATLAQRLTRAKQKIRDSGIRFEEPEAREIPERLHAVLEAIYGAYGVGWDAVAGAEVSPAELCEEALYLTDVVCALQPESAEALGLRALLLFCEARRAARFAADGAFIPLPEQDVALWNRAGIVLADQLLWRAASMRVPGPFQLEAAVQSAHCHRIFTGRTPWTGIAQLYGELVTHYPTIGAQVALAVAQGECGLIAQAAAQLASVDQTKVHHYQPWWVAMAYVHAMSDEPKAALAAYGRALELTTQPAIRAYLAQKVRDLRAAAQQSSRPGGVYGV